MESLAIARSDYEQKKGRYEDQNSSVYQNAWYKEKYLTPAFAKYSAKTDELAKLEAKSSSQDASGFLQVILKVLFRISAMVLSVMLAEAEFLKGIRGIAYG